jgi:hypothetical protein
MILIRMSNYQAAPLKQPMSLTGAPIRSDNSNTRGIRMVIGRARRVKWRRLLALMIIAGVLTLNGVAWMQAWAMTHYLPAGQRTPKPEALSPGEKISAIITGVKVPRPQNERTPADVGLSFEVHTIDIAGGESLEAWYVPQSQPVGIILMFPGYAESKQSLLPAASALHDMGYDLLLVDFRGAGGSSGNDTTLGVREGKDVVLAVEYATRTWPGSKVALYGVSMGSVAVMRAIAKEGVQPDAAILESPFDGLLSTVRNRFHAMGLPAFPGAELLVFWGSVQHGFNGFEHNPLDYASSVKCPALLLSGENDPRVTLEQARVIYERLGGEKEFVNFPGAGHEALVVDAPEVWRERVRQFLNHANFDR